MSICSTFRRGAVLRPPSPAYARPSGEEYLRCLYTLKVLSDVFIRHDRHDPQRVPITTDLDPIFFRNLEDTILEDMSGRSSLRRVRAISISLVALLCARGAAQNDELVLGNQGAAEYDLQLSSSTRLAAGNGVTVGLTTAPAVPAAAVHPDGYTLPTAEQDYRPFTAFHSVAHCPENYRKAGVYCGTAHNSHSWRFRWPTTYFYILCRVISPGQPGWVPPHLSTITQAAAAVGLVPSSSAATSRFVLSPARGPKSGRRLELQCPNDRLCRTHGGRPNRQGGVAYTVDISRQAQIDCVRREDYDMTPFRKYQQKLATRGDAQREPRIRLSAFTRTAGVPVAVPVVSAEQVGPSTPPATPAVEVEVPAENAAAEDRDWWFGFTPDPRGAAAAGGSPQMHDGPGV